LLGHVLYSRRLFPYYSFNAIAGIEDGVAHLYRYDCVGSFEDVASLCAGKAEHLIQPFLDRLASGVEEEDQLWLSNTDTFSSSRSPCVAIGLEEAVELLLRAFRAASEREITVGDGLYVWILERGKETVDKRFFSLPQV
jgi:20S proteasome subunit beta 6